MDIALEQLDASQVLQLASPRESEASIAASLQWRPMDDGWKARLGQEEDRAWWVRDSEAVPPADLMPMLPLKERLLSIGGESVCVNSLDEDLGNILARGVLWRGAGATMMIGIHNQCHANSANIWSNNRDRTVVATGYALSEDGMWRQHSWVVAFDVDNGWEPGIVETTSPRVAYFGFPMTTAESEQFEYWNS